LDTDSGWSIPWDANSQDDIDAVETSLQFGFSWYNDPVHFGDYPPQMKELITGGRLPVFTEEEKLMVKGSFDFIGVNHYGAAFVHHSGVVGTDFNSDGRYWTSSTNISGDPVGPVAQSSWLNVYPEGMRGLLNWISNRYNNTKIYVFENGVSVPGENDMPLEEALNDTFRLNFYKDYIN
jgi:beta-glucosidase